MKSKPTKKATTLYIDPDLLKLAKKHCLDIEVPFQDWVSQAIREKLDRDTLKVKGE